jgi:glutathione synthase
MRITILVNDVATEHPLATTTLLAHTATRRGHSVNMLGVPDLTYFPDGRIGGVARVAPKRARTPAAFLRGIQAREAKRVTVTTDDMDLFWLRYNPSEELEADRWWGQDAGMLFGRLAVERGVVVISDPDSLLFARDKLYMQHFPESVRPRTLVTRNVDEVRKFYEESRHRIVLKPLTGYGGADVFLVKNETTNLRQIVEAVGRAGFVMVQEYLPEATGGDTRFYLLNGEPLVVDGKYAAIRRVPGKADFRANLTAGGEARKPKITDRMLELAGIVGPRLRHDGIFFAGLDIVGDRIVEINTISTGALNSTQRLQGVDFASAIVELVERKVAAKAQYGCALPNRVLATLS